MNAFASPLLMVTSPKRSASPLPTRERIPVAHISEVEFGEPEIAENDYLSRLPDALAQRILAYVVKSSDDPKLQLCRIAMVSRHWRLQASNRELWAPLVPQLAYFDSPNRTLRQYYCEMQLQAAHQQQRHQQQMKRSFQRLKTHEHLRGASPTSSPNQSPSPRLAPPALMPLGRVNPNLNSPAATPYFEFSSLLVPGKENGSRTPATPALPPNSLSATLGFTPTPLRRPQRQIAPIVLHSAPMAPARAESPALSGTATGASNPSAIPASPATPRARQLRDSGSSRSATRPHSAAGSLARQRRRLHLS